jgi:hypothetical protein
MTMTDAEGRSPVRAVRDPMMLLRPGKNQRVSVKGGYPDLCAPKSLTDNLHVAGRAVPLLSLLRPIQSRRGNKMSVMIDRCICPSVADAD